MPYVYAGIGSAHICILMLYIRNIAAGMTAVGIATSDVEYQRLFPLGLVLMRLSLKNPSMPGVMTVSTMLKYESTCELLLDELEDDELDEDLDEDDEELDDDDDDEDDDEDEDDEDDELWLDELEDDELDDDDDDEEWELEDDDEDELEEELEEELDEDELEDGGFNGSMYQTTSWTSVQFVKMDS
jgi:hypothetical protein